MSFESLPNSSEHNFWYDSTGEFSLSDRSLEPAGVTEEDLDQHALDKTEVEVVEIPENIVLGEN